MNASQFILLFASFIILSASILLVNKSSVETEEERVKAKNQIIAISEAKNLFEEIKTKIFDEKIFSLVTLNKDSLTNPINLGPDNEDYSQFDDIDDFNNYTKEIFLTNNARYKLQVLVNYVREDNPDVFSSTPTFYKLVRIKCFNQSQVQIFELKQIFSVW